MPQVSAFPGSSWFAMKRLATSLPKHEMEALNMRYIRFKELRKSIPLGRTTIWRMMREGRFPQSRRIGKMAAAWLESEVEEWTRQRAEEGGKPQMFAHRRQFEQI